MFSAIVVPLDGSKLAERALPIAARLARETGSVLHLVHVHTPTAAPIVIEDLPVIDEELHSLAADHERVYLERLAEAMADDVLAPVPIRLSGRVIPTLTGYAQAVQAGLMVLTSHGRSGFDRLWLGSVAEALVRVAPAPVLLLRPGPDGRLPEKPFRRVLVPLDGSQLAEAALPAAAAIARAEGGELELLQLVDVTPFPEALPFHERFRLDEGAEAAELLEAEVYLQTIAAREPAVPTRWRAASTDHPARAILAAGAEADLVAITTHGSGAAHGGMSHVADKVLRGLGRPLLVVRPEGVGAP